MVNVTAAPEKPKPHAAQPAVPAAPDEDLRRLHDSELRSFVAGWCRLWQPEYGVHLQAEPWDETKFEALVATHGRALRAAEDTRRAWRERRRETLGGAAAPAEAPPGGFRRRWYERDLAEAQGRT